MTRLQNETLTKRDLHALGFGGGKMMDRLLLRLFFGSFSEVEIS